MKKTVLLLLALVMCLSLLACGGDSQDGDTTATDETNATTPESALVGTWKNVNAESIVFNEDGTGVAPAGDNLAWRYDKESKWYYISYQGLTFTFTIDKGDGNRVIVLEGMEFFHSEDFEKFFPVYVAEEFAKLTEGKTELVVGDTYTTEGGVSFRFDKAELSGDDTECMFNLYLIYEGLLEFGQAEYRSPGHRSGFGLAHQDTGSEGTTHRFAGGFEERKALEAHRDSFGLLMFTIEGVEYYVQIDSFFA